MIDRGIRAVFFDAGETLLHPYPSFPELLTETLRIEGQHVDPAAIRAELRLVSERFAEAARQNELWSTSPERSQEFWRDVYRILLGELGLEATDALAERLYAVFTDLDNYRLFDDVEPCLERLTKQGFELGLVSNFEEWLEHLLDSLGVTRYFPVRVISGAEGYEKPDPKIFELALERAGVTAGESAYVGDNPFFDAEPAAVVGMLPVLIDRRGRYPDFDGVRITTLDDLDGALGR